MNIPSKPMNQPPCATWEMWKGGEVEGNVSVGVQTLFIRSLDKFPQLTPDSDFSVLRTRSGCSRVWFCKEFLKWKFIDAIAPHFDETCIEVEPQAFTAIPNRLRKLARIYVKVILPDGLNLKAGDFICVGPPFNDESFQIGRGNKVKPEQYLNDVKIV